MMSCAAHHCVAVRDGLAVAFASGNGGNRFGQLGRGTATSSSNRRNDDESSGSRQPMSMTLPADAEGLTVVAAAAGGDRDGGHSAVVLSDGSVLTCGCDRWQQLGLGSSASGAAGYTWKNGRIWQPLLQRVESLARPSSDDDQFVDVACGADYTIVRSRKGRVVGFGRSHLGQVTGNGKRGPFVTAPVDAVRNADRGGSTGIAEILTNPEGDCTILIRNLKEATSSGISNDADAWWERLTRASAETSGALEMNGKCSKAFVQSALREMITRNAE
jgi:hypothetical protein